MTDVAALVQPFVRRGLFDSPENAVAEMAREYVLRQVERYRIIIEAMESKHGMSYAQFDAYLRSRAARLQERQEPALNRAIMAEEEDALEWKIASEMLLSWLGLQSEMSQ